MKNIAIIQLTRLGDLIQTVQAAYQAKINRKDIKFHLIARKRFAAPMNTILSQVFDEVHYIDATELVSDNLKSSLTNVKNTLVNINSYKFDVCINLSFCKTSSYLASLINATHRLGMYRNEFGELAIEDKWSQLTFSSVMTGKYNPYNLVDIYRNIIGTSGMEPFENTTDVRSHTVKKFCIHPFASDRKKTWNLDKWPEVIYDLNKKFPNSEFFILGSNAEKKQSDVIASSTLLADIKIHNMVGECTLEETSRIVSEATCFLGNDSMLSHLAALHGIPSVTISLGPVKPHESFPYNKRAVTVCSKVNCFPCEVQTKCDLLSCHKDIHHNLIGHLAEALVEGHKLDANYIVDKINIFHLQSVRVYTPDFTKDGYMYISDIASNDTSYDDIIRLLNRIIFDLYLSQRDFKSDIPSLTREVAGKLMEDMKIISQLFEVYNHGSVFAKKLVAAIDKDTAALNQIVAKIQEVERLAMTAKTLSPAASVLVDFFTACQRNSPGSSLRDITQSYLVTFYDASNLSAMAFELLNQMVSPYVKVKSSESSV